MQFLDTKLPPPILATLTVIFMYLSKGWFPVFSMPTYLTFMLSGTLLFLGLMVGCLAVWEFHKAQTSITPINPHKASSIVDSGIFSVSRNPMYVSLGLSVAAIGVVLHHSGFALLVLTMLMYLHYFQIKPEEKILAEKFGEEYELYCKTVPRWLF